MSSPSCPAVWQRHLPPEAASQREAWSGDGSPRAEAPSSGTVGGMAASQDLKKISAPEMEGYYCLLQAAALLDSSLQRVTSPICARDIREPLMKEFAFLSGGRGQDDCWIITCPENSAFQEAPEQTLQQVLCYLTSIVSQNESNTKFILILDRRLDTWTSVRMSLQKLANSFPGNLHLVLVLRPTGFFQRTFTDIGFRFSQEDFILKLPVVMLSSVADLLKYIDEKQLTAEFGGSLEYCHSDWIIFRTAIESFALTVKEIAQMLQSFGTELAEAELPEDIYSIECILSLRTERYCQLKDDITTVTKEGNTLLRNLEEPASSTEGLELRREKHVDWETVHRLLAQLHEMETAFDGFWEKHQLKMEQYLELWKFERNFQEVKKSTDCLMAQQVDLPDTGDSLSVVKQRLADLGTLDENLQDLSGKSQVVILHGHQLAANHHYALDLICQRCNELRHISDTLTDEIKNKHARLIRTLELLIRLQQAQECCDEGAYLLANQQMDKCQSKEGAQRALHDIEKFLENSSLYLNHDPQELHYEFESILTTELNVQIQAVYIKLENVRGMFGNRQAFLKKLADKHVRPVQLVAPRPENQPRAKSPLFSPKHGVDFNSSLKFSFDITLPGKKATRKTQGCRKIEVMHDYQEKRNSLQLSISEHEDSLDTLKSHVIHELIETERVYVEELFTVLMGYRAEMDSPDMMDFMPPALRNTKNVLFGNMPEIYDFHNKVFLQNLESCLGSPDRVGSCFLERRKDFQMYEKYCQNKPRSESLWRQFSDSAFFQECQKKLNHKLGLDSYLLKPVQRLTKYQLLLKELLKFSNNSDGIQELQEALDAMLNLLKSVNDSMHQTAITGYDGDINEFGKVLMQGSFSVWTGHKKGPTKMKDLARFKPMQRHLFLYEKAIVFCKKREEHGYGYDKTPSYSFKHFLQMNAVGITENVKGDPRKFEIWYSGREEVYVVQSPTVDQKMAWLNEIRTILTKQRELMKVEKHQQNHCSDHTQLSPQLNSRKQQRTSVSSEENESEPTGPSVLDSILLSPQNKPNRSWPGMSQSVEICEGLEDWTCQHYLCNTSDTEEEDGPQWSPGKYKALADCRKREAEDVMVKHGDLIELMHEDREGRCSLNSPLKPVPLVEERTVKSCLGAAWSLAEDTRLVKNLSRRKEGWIPSKNLQIILGDAGFRNAKVSDAALCNTRKLSSP
ncbi:proto-oncogene DBL isoform X2 [Ambystoma mexicanum]|uniref:proto-oncogene DBL isoform X2 n=1 Tax=Ambystoma mexicanum TaxID=8296 RepID=UPI0037E70E8A